MKIYDEQFRAVDKSTGAPLAGQAYRMSYASGDTFQGVTDEQGKTERLSGADAESLQIEWIGEIQAFRFPDEANIENC